MKFSLIIPCYNEVDNLPLLLEKCKTITVKKSCEVLLVDNGSTDQTDAVLKKLLPSYPGCRTVRIEQNIGYGFGIITGLRLAKGDILGWTHADLQTDPQDILKGLVLFDKYSENIFVKGKRYGRPIADVFFTIGMSIFETLLLKKQMWDINAQPTLFSKKFFESWKSPPDDFSIDLYAYYMAKAQGLKVYRFPVKFSERMHGMSSWNINWRAKLKFIRRTVLFSLILKRKKFK